MQAWGSEAAARDERLRKQNIEHLAVLRAQMESQRRRRRGDRFEPQAVAPQAFIPQRANAHPGADRAGERSLPLTTIQPAANGDFNYKSSAANYTSPAAKLLPPTQIRMGELAQIHSGERSRSDRADALAPVQMRHDRILRDAAEISESVLDDQHSTNPTLHLPSVEARPSPGHSERVRRRGPHRPQNAEAGQGVAESLWGMSMGGGGGAGGGGMGGGGGPRMAVPGADSEARSPPIATQQPAALTLEWMRGVEDKCAAAERRAETAATRLEAISS